MKVAFLIRSLGLGGAERQLMLLAAGLKSAGHDVSVITFYEGGAFAPALAAAGVQVHSLGKSGRWHVAGFLVRLVRIVRQLSPDVLHGYLPSGNLLALVAKPFVGTMKVVWGVRASTVNLTRYDRVTRLTYRLEARLARWADLIIANSEAGGALYRRAGCTKVVVIGNGFDTEAMAPDPQAGAAARAALGIGRDEAVIGFVARIDPMKDHETFIEAASRAAARDSTLRFVCFGGGPGDAEARLQSRARALGLGERITWAGARDDMRAVYSAFDIATLVSRGEGFPNVVGEAMACGVPCVVTDVGAAAEIVGDTGIVVPPGDAPALARAWQDMLERLRAARPALRARARQRIVDNFSVAALTAQTLAALAALCQEWS